MVTHLEPDILECEVKWALPSVLYCTHLCMKCSLVISNFLEEISIPSHSRRGTIKDRNGKDLTEAEEIKKSWQEQTEELYKTGVKTQVTMMV